jgi:GT2 family glycosyltransferase
VRWELFVVDNASTDHTPCILSKHGLGQVDRNAENIGFGRAHNQNAGRFRGRYLLFLNPDLELPADFFAGVVRYLDDTPSVAIAGPAILEGPSRIPFPPRHFFPGEMLMPLTPPLAPEQPAWLNGCCLAIRRSVFESLQGFDPAYFLYFEEVDFCWRARQAGWRLGWIPQFEVIHAGLGSQADISEYDQARRLFAGAMLFWKKRYAERDQVSMLRFQVFAAGILITASQFFGRRWFRHRGLRPDRLRARRDICREWLERNEYGVWTPDPRCLRIAARLTRFAAKWVLREIPLEDV